MQELTDVIMYHIQKQGFVIVSTLDSEGGINVSCKGIVGMDKEGRIYLIDLYRGRTFKNLKSNPTVSVTSIDAHEFTGYTLKGKAEIIERDKIEGHIIKKWEEKVIQRISDRVIKNVQSDTKSFHHPEAKFPQPQYMIVIDVEEITDLTPTHLKKDKV
ncbi:MAG: pyridoxamine 5'-phosphate oxidase family protein [Candidatus Omnitrophica bacterium]|nr:pyridoxamine 5'-phosphate oxidase family protein [Candidatus Omnitrophota bacterium]